MEGPDLEGEDHLLHQLHHHQVVLHDHWEFIPGITNCKYDVKQSSKYFQQFNIKTINYQNLKRHYQSNFPGSLWPQKVGPGDTQRAAWRQHWAHHLALSPGRG